MKIIKISLLSLFLAFTLTANIEDFDQEAQYDLPENINEEDNYSYVGPLGKLTYHPEFFSEKKEDLKNLYFYLKEKVSQKTLSRYEAEEILQNFVEKINNIKGDRLDSLKIKYNDEFFCELDEMRDGIKGFLKKIMNFISDEKSDVIHNFSEIYIPKDDE